MQQNLLRKEITDIIKRKFSSQLKESIELPKSGSPRKYWRLILNNEKSLILCCSENIGENKTFIALDRIFRERKINVPEIFYVAEDFTYYIQEDLGTECLLDLIKSEKNDTDTTTDRSLVDFAIRRALSGLIDFHLMPSDQWDKAVGFPQMDSTLIQFDFNYCINNFLNVAQPGTDSVINYDSSALHRDLNKLNVILTDYPERCMTFMYRDFQSRNIMLKRYNDHDDGVDTYFIDFQSGRKGPGVYDLVSFLWQAKAGFTKEERKKYVDYYSEKINLSRGGIKQIIDRYLPYFSCLRQIQVLGAYGLRGLKEGKTHFIESIPLALNNFKEIIIDNNLEVEFPELYGIILKLYEIWTKN